jgi:hypothetical protein
LRGEDHKIYEICVKDFKNYVIYLTRTHEKIGDAPTMGQPTNLILLAMNDSGNGVYENTKEVSGFLDVWVNLWYKKWQERTKVIFEAPKFGFSNGGKLGVLSSEELMDLIGITIDKLIQHGEICCTQIIASELIKKAVGDMKENTTTEKLMLVSKLQRQAKEMSYIHGPLVFFCLNKISNMREWRDTDSDTNIIG